VYDLRRRVTRLKQTGGSLEKYFTDLQGLWREIDFRCPNPMECVGDIQRYNDMLQEDRVYSFLDGLDDKLDNIRNDILQMRPFPTIEQAYAHVRREAVRQTVMSNNGPSDNPGAILASKGFKPGHSTPGPNRSLSLANGKAGTASKPHASSSDGTKCSHCGNLKHTRDNCFKLHGYPDWWNELQARKRREATDGETSQVAVAAAEETKEMAQGDLPNTKPGTALCGSSQEGDQKSWVVDSGATDHMTFDETDFSKKSPPRRTCIANANGVLSPVTGAGTVDLSPTLSLTHTLLVPSLSHKLLSVSQVTEALNCVVLMYATFCLLQDILTKEIIGRGTKRGGFITWMISVWGEHITCTLRLTRTSNRFGYGIVG
jgi:hypothetical protein